MLFKARSKTLEWSESQIRFDIDLRTFPMAGMVVQRSKYSYHLCLLSSIQNLP